MMAFVDRTYTISLSCPYNSSCINIYTADDFHGKLGHSNLLIQKLLSPFLTYLLLCCEIYNLRIVNHPGQELFFSVFKQQSEVLLLPGVLCCYYIMYLTLLNNVCLVLYESF